jgi:tetratricopeptide (TPR) repeat protein
MNTFLKRASFLLIVFNLVFFVHTAKAQNDKEQMAKDLVKQGQYAEAIPYFENLADLYPADKELNYYLGMCLVETGQFSEKAKTALQISLGDDTPEKSLYYLAQCFHAENNFSEALNYYQQFDDQAKKKTKKTTRLDELMVLCQEQTNPFRMKIEAQTQPETQQADTLATLPVVPLKPEEVKIPEEWKDSLISFQVNSYIKYLQFDHFKNGASLQAFIHALKAEKEVQSLSGKTSRLREEYDSAFASGKEEIANQILELEKEMYSKNKEISQGYQEARAKESDYWEQADPLDIKTFSERVHSLEDSVLRAKTLARLQKLEAKKPIVLPDSLFNIAAQEKAAAADQGVIYKVQIGAYSKSPPDWVQKIFKKLSVIRRIDEYTDAKGVTVYTVGELKSYEDALQMQSQVRMEGVKDAVVAAYLNRKRIPVNEARKISEQ